MFAMLYALVEIYCEYGTVHVYMCVCVCVKDTFSLCLQTSEEREEFFMIFKEPETCSLLSFLYFHLSIHM